jgi:hypothetical protein
MRWIRDELRGEPYALHVVTTVPELIAHVRRHELPPRIAVCDFDSLQDDDITELLAFSECSWDGVLVALGNVGATVQALLSIGEVILPPYGSERLRKTIEMLSEERTEEIDPLGRGARAY